MKKLFTITESERERILGLHNDFRKKQYSDVISEQVSPLNQPLSTGQFNVSANLPKIQSSATPEQKKLIDGANSWIESNKASIPKTVAEITKFLNDQVTAKKLTPESLPYIKAALQSNSNGTLKFPDAELGGNPQQPAQGGGQWLTFPGDKNYEYLKKDNKWFTRKKGTTKEFDLSSNPKYKGTVDKLNKQFPDGKTPAGGDQAKQNVTVKNETLPGAPVYYPWIQDGKVNAEKLKQSVEDNSIYTWGEELKKLTPEQLAKVKEDFVSSGLNVDNLTTTKGTGLRLVVNDLFKQSEAIVAQNNQGDKGTQGTQGGGPGNTAPEEL